MSNKLVSRLLSFTLSATVALTSGVPALAYDGGGGELPEDEELQILEEEEDVGADFGVLNDIEVVEDAEFQSGSVSATITYTQTGLESWTAPTEHTSFTMLIPDSSTNSYPVATVPTVAWYDSTPWSITSGPLPSGITFDQLAGEFIVSTSAADQDVVNATMQTEYSPKEYGITYHFSADGGSTNLTGVSNSNSNTVTIDDLDGDQKYSLTAPSKSGYTFDGWFANPDYSTGALTDDKLQIVEATGTYNIYGKFSSTTAGDLQIVTSDTFAYTYANETADKVTYTAQVRNNTNTGWVDCEDVSWSLYRIKEDAPAIDTGAITDPRYASSNLEPVTSLADYGIAFAQDSTDPEKFVFSTTGPKKALNAQFLLKVTSTEDPTKVAILEKNFKINDFTGLTISDTEGSSAAGRIDFRNAQMGYSVEDYAASPSYDEPYVMAHKVELSTTTLNSNYGLDDLTYVWEGDTDAFVFESDGKGVWTANKETIIIYPNENLDNWNDEFAGTTNTVSATAHDGIYVATLYAKSKGFAEKKAIATVTFKVTSNIALSSVTAHGGKAAKKLARKSITLATATTDVTKDYFYAGATNDTKASASTTSVYVDEYDLGTVKVGSSFSDVLITATGGVGKIQIVEPYSIESGVSSTAFVTGRNIVGTPSDATGTATFRVSSQDGTVVDSSAVTFEFLLQANDAHGYKSMVQAYKLTVEKADVSYSIADTELEGNTVSAADNQYYWYSVAGYTPANEAKTLIISNNSEDSITIEAGMFTDAGTLNTNDTSGNFVITGFDAPIANKQVTIGSGSSKALTITPKAGVAAGSNIATSIKLSGTGVDTTAVNLKFSINANDLEITKPAGTYTWNSGTSSYDANTPYALNLEVGKPFTYAIGTTASDKVSSVKWAVTSVGGSTSAAAIKAFQKDYGISINESTGILVGTPIKPAVATTVVITATPTLTSGTAVPVPCAFNITITGSADEFELSANGSVIDDDENILDLGTVSIDKIDTVAQAFAVKNVSSLDIAKAKVTIDTTSSHIRRGDTLAAAKTDADGDNDTYDFDNFFKLVFDAENENLDTELATNGFALKKTEARAITLMINEGASPKFTKATANKGTYWIPVNVVDAADATNSKTSFIAKIKVTDAPIIGTAGIGAITVGSEIKQTTSTIKYAVSVAGADQTDNYTFAWAEGSVPGLTLAPNGVIYGTATEAGDFKVTVKATNKKNSSISGVLTHEITVTGNATINITSSAVGNPTGKFVLLPGIVVGSEVNKTVETFNVTSSTDTAKNVVITVEDADDDRTDLAAIKKSPANPYAGSTNYIGVNKTGFSEITTTGTENFSIVTKSSVAPGVYKVKITITSTNANKKVFYAIMAVVDKFAITKPGDIATKVGKDYTATLDTATTSYYTEGDLEISATGGAGGQAITWSEAGTKVAAGASETTEYYVTATGAANAASSITGLKLEAAKTRIDGKATIAAPGTALATAAKTGAKTYLTTPTAIKKAGTYSVTLKAKIAAADVNTTVADEMSEIISLSGAANIIKATATKAFPEQEAAPVTFTISSSKSDLVEISNVTDTLGLGTVEGFKNGNVYVTRTGYTYDPAVTSYNNTTYGITVTVSNSMIGISTKAKAAFSENSNFEIVGGSEKTLSAAVAGPPIATGDDSFTFRPKAKLAKGTYTDTLTITGNEFEPITFAVSFTVADATYLADISGTVDGETVKYAEKNVAVSGKTVVLDNYVVDGTKTSNTLTVKNVGNSALSKVSVYEVKADGSKYGAGSSETMINPGVIATSIDVGATKTFTVTASKNKAGVYTTYVNLHFTEGVADAAVERDVWIPITYTVYAKDIEDVKVSPETKTTVTVAENYAPKDAAAEFVVKNDAEGAAYTVTGYTVASTDANFEILPKTFKDLKAGESATFKIQPKSGKMLSAGEYTTKIRVSGGNIKTAIEREVVLKVTESDEYTVKATSVAAGGVTIDNADIAEKLYNTFAIGKALDLTNATTSETTKTVNIDIDEDGTDDVSLTFTFGAAVTNKASIVSQSFTDVTAKILGTNINTASKGMTLKATEQKAAAGGHGNTGAGTTDDPNNAKYFTSVTFNFYGVVKFGANGTTWTVPGYDGTLYAEKASDLENDYVHVQGAITTAGTYKGNASGFITALVPYGSKVGSVFNNGKLPTAVDPGTAKLMTAWQAGTVIISADKAIYKDYNASTIVWHTHTYPAANNKDEKYVKWVWSTDEKGNLSTELHLHCTDPDCPDYAGSEVVIKDTMTAAEIAKIPGWSAGIAGGDTLVTYGARAGKDADCEHGSRYEYPAQAIYGGITYKNSKVEDEEGQPLGHQFNLKIDPDIVWVDKNEDGLMTVDEVTVTRTCSRCGEPIELTVLGISEKDKVEPTCTKAGSVQYVISYTEVTEDGKPGATVEKNYKEVTELKAKGHAKELLAVVEDFNEETLIAAKLTLTCPDCNEVLFEKTNVQFTDNGDGTYSYKALITSTGEYYNVSYTNHAHVWEGEWSWASDYSKATLTITCKQGTRPEVKEFTVDSVVTKKGAVYTYTVEYTYTWTEKGEAKTKTFTDSKELVKSDDGQVIEDIIPIAEDLGIYIEGLEAEYFYTGAPIKPSFSVIDASTGLVYLVPGVDYTVSYKNNKKLGDTATITVKGKGNYDGQSAIATFKILDPKTDVAEEDVIDLKGYKVSVPKDVVLTYNGEAQMPSKIVVKKGKAATTYTWDSTGYVDEKGEAIDAVVTVSNNIEAGTAKLLLTGKNNDKGTATTAGTTFKIAPAPLAGDGVALSIDPTKLQWAAKGARPAVTVTWNGQELLEGRDFTVTYKKNTKIGASASVVVKGKGNFDKKTELSKGFEVEAFDLASAEIIAATGVAAGKAAKSVKVTVIDANGDVIPASKLAVVVKADDTVVTGKLVEKTEYTIVATPKSAKVAEVTGETPAFTVTAGADFGKAKVTVAKEFYKTYTGEAIELEEEDLKYITVTIGPKKTAKTLVCGEDFTIAGYTNNIKKGKMTVTLKGIDEAGYTGAKTFTIKIKAKQLVK